MRDLYAKSKHRCGLDKANFKGNKIENITSQCKFDQLINKPK